MYYMHEEIEYPNEDLVQKHVDCNGAYIKTVSSRWKMGLANDVPRPASSSAIK